MNTWVNYLKEIDNKYVGQTIKSKKYSEIYGEVIQGQKVIEVPSINQNSSKLADFEAKAAEYNTIIRFRDE